LSYSDFHVVSATASVGARDAVTVTARVTNTSARAGTDVIQAYLTKQPITGQPVRLVAFGRVSVAAHGSSTVTLQVSAGDLSRWVPSRSTWFVAAGKYQLRIGDSVENLPRTVTVRLGGIYSGLDGITVPG
jgi:beta-glucosidase